MASKLKGGEIEMDGLKLLLHFALGALKDGVCGNDNFVAKVERFLSGDEKEIAEIVSEIPEQLKTAYPALVATGKKLNKDPLAFETIFEYVVNGHNTLVVKKECMAKIGIVLLIEGDYLSVVERGTQSIARVNYLGRQNFKKGDYIIFHRNWFVCKIKGDEKQKYSSLFK